MSTESERGGLERWKRRLPGDAETLKRLPVTPSGVREVLRRPSGSFPYLAPTWPDSIPREPAESELGIDYDTAWARKYPARMARVLLTEGITRPAVQLLASPTIEGLDRINHLDGPVVFAPNHASHVDTPLLLSILPDRWRYKTASAGAADYFFDTKLKAATFALTIGAIPLERRRVSRDSARLAQHLIEDGWSLLIYPEGGRSPDGWGQAHNAGAAWLAARTGAPIVPIHIAGTSRILAKGDRVPRPGKTTVTFGRPLRGDNARKLAVEVEAAIEALGDESSSDWWSARRRAARKASPSLTGPSAGSWRRSWALGDRSRGRQARKTRNSRSGRWPKV